MHCSLTKEFCTTAEGGCLSLDGVLVDTFLSFYFGIMQAIEGLGKDFLFSRIADAIFVLFSLCKSLMVYQPLIS